MRAWPRALAALMAASVKSWAAALATAAGVGGDAVGDGDWSGHEVFRFFRKRPTPGAKAPEVVDGLQGQG